MTIKRFLSTPDGPAVAAAAAAGTVMITFQIAGKATRDALFLSSFGVAALPGMVIAAAVVSAVVSVLLARVMARTRPSRLVPRLFGLSAVLLLAEWALAVQARRPAAAIVYLHFTALGALLVSGFWAIVNERFDPRTARRTISHITAGGSLGGLLGGLLPERVGATLSLTAMLPILAGLHLLSALLVLGVERGATHSPPGQGEEPFLSQEPQPGAARILQASPYLLGLALLVTLTSAAEGVLDYVFKAHASAAATSGEDLLRLFAVFYTVTALLGISIQVTTLRRVLGRLGIARSAALLPAGVSLGAVGAFIVPGLIPVMLARGAEVVLRSSIFRAAYELLFTPVAPREKRATKLLIDVGAARLGDVAGGALIAAALVLTGAAAGRILLGVSVALSVGALAVARRLHLGYVSALEGSLQRRAGEVSDPLPDEGSALLQTVGGFDLSGIRPRAGFASAAASVTAVPPPAPLASSPTLLRQAVDSGNREAIQHALATEPIMSDQIEHAIELLAWDEVAPQTIRALRAVAHTETAVFVRHLLDPAEDFAIRRRLVTVLAASRRREAFEGLFEAMRDRRFEVRYRAARALNYLAREIPGLQIDRDRVFDVVLQEMAVERGIWETRQLIDLPDDDTSPMEAEVLRGRASSSLEHLFTLLSLVLPSETVRLAFHSLHTGDRHLRGTALEYLETVLPEAVWQKLWPFLDEGELQPARPGRASGEAMQELLASQESIGLALAEIRRREGR